MRVLKRPGFVVDMVNAMTLAVADSAKLMEKGGAARGAQERKVNNCRRPSPRSVLAQITNNDKDGNVTLSLTSNRTTPTPQRVQTSIR